MKYGVIISPTTDTIQPGDLARELETRGFDSLWFPEHTHMPVKARKGDVPDSYGLTYDPFIALTWAAAASRYLLLGTGICLMAQRDPIITAKTISTLDQLSRGRVRIGVGGGWNRPEMENHGVEFSRRWNSVEEKVCAMKEIWTHQPASFEGEQIQFEPMVSGPKPFQDPHPPVFMGATGKEALERVVRYCDGWIPLASELDDLEGSLKQLKELARQAGRDFNKFELSIFAAPRDPKELQRFANLGATRAIFMVRPRKPEEVLEDLDELSDLTASAKSIVD